MAKNPRNIQKPGSVLDRLIGSTKREYSAQPITFLISIIGAVGLLYSAVISLPALVSPLQVQPVDISIVLKACGFFVLQGTLASIHATAQASTSRMGDGYPILVKIILAIIAGWLSSFISFWLAVVGSPSWGLAASWFAAASIASWLLSGYFLELRFKEAFGAGQLSPPGFGTAFVLFSIALFVLSTYFGWQISPYIYAKN